MALKPDHWSSLFRPCHTILTHIDSYTKAIQLIPPLSRHINQIRALLFSILRLSCFTTDFRVASRNSIGFQYEFNIYGGRGQWGSRMCFAHAASGIWCHAPPTTPSKHNNTFSGITYFASRSHWPWMPSFPYVVLKHTLNRCYSIFFLFQFCSIFNIFLSLFSLTLPLGQSVIYHFSMLAAGTVKHL